MAGPNPPPPPQGPPRTPGIPPDEDFTTDQIDPALKPDPTTRPFNPEPAREKIRGLLAMTLVGAVIAEIAAAMGAAIAGVDTADITSILEPTLGPLVALAGSATGF